MLNPSKDKPRRTAAHSDEGVRDMRFLLRSMDAVWLAPSFEGLARLHLKSRVYYRATLSMREAALDFFCCLGHFADFSFLPSPPPSTMKAAACRNVEFYKTLHERKGTSGLAAQKPPEVPLLWRGERCSRLGETSSRRLSNLFQLPAHLSFFFSLSLSLLHTFCVCCP